MLTALSPTAALRADLERGRRDAPVAPAVERDDDLAAWTLVATMLDRLDALPAEDRPAHATRAGGVLAARTHAPVTGTPARAATVTLQQALHRWGSGDATAAEVVEAVRAVVEDMERGGALALARTSLVAILGTAAAAGTSVHGTTLAHLGRVRRQMGELDAAIRLYDAAAALAAEAGDGALAARAEVGRGVIFWQRGNFPAAREAYARALEVAPAGSPVAVGAHHGLMLVSIGAGDLAKALLHGWRAFADAGEEPDRRAEALINLGGLCRRVGEHDAALRAFRASLTLTETARLRLRSAARRSPRHRSGGCASSSRSRARPTRSSPRSASRGRSRARSSSSGRRSRSREFPAPRRAVTMRVSSSPTRMGCTR